MFSEKKLKVVIQRTEGVFFPGTPTLTFENLPIEVFINKVALSRSSNFKANIKIYGISKEKMDALTTIRWRDLTIVQKAVRVYADDGDGEKCIYEGNIETAIPVYSAPDIYIEIVSNAGTFFNVKSELPPSHLEGNVSVPSFFEKICKDYGTKCVNHGVFGFCDDPSVDGCGLQERLRKAGDAYSVEAVINNDSVDIYPTNVSVFDFIAPPKPWILTKDLYINYPTLSIEGIKVTIDKILPIKIKDRIVIKDSEVSAANGQWNIAKMEYNLSTKIGGNWTITIHCYGTGVINV